MTNNFFFNNNNYRYNIMLACWNSSPRSRPTFTELKHDLNALMSSNNKHDYLNMNDSIQVPYKI